MTAVVRFTGVEYVKITEAVPVSDAGAHARTMTVRTVTGEFVITLYGRNAEALKIVSDES